ncbi:MAG TPA: hypothetical protein VFF65_01150 [Phycisphaerales bacterium]|nr:hypothetical protein [Phycisphaerales bacterium]
MRTISWGSLMLTVLLLGAGCRPQPRPAAASDTAAAAAAADQFVGAWRAQLQFSSGAFAPIKDLEFMYVFNEGGTMTESSNYDASPPVPPAYGIWRKTGERRYEAKYEFYVTKAPARFDEISKGGGWGPAGRGVFVEQITVSEDGRSFTSKIKYDQFGTDGKPAEGGGEATGKGTKLTF